MFASMLDDGLNPKFVYLSPAFLDEFGPDGTLPHDRLATHIGAAVDAFHTGEGRGRHCSSEEVSVVRELTVEYLSPVVAPGTLRVDVWVEQLDESSCSYGFLCSSEDQRTPYARGERTLVKLDPELHRPAAWSDDFIQEQSKLLRTLHAYA